MNSLVNKFLLILVIVLQTVTMYGQGESNKCRIAPAPLFRDPVYDGAADPMVIYHNEEQAWYMFYTNRRANVPLHGVSWCYGTDIGVAVSKDGGQTWIYKGALDLAFEQGANTFWAPHVVYDKGKYHLFVTYIRGIRETWSGTGKIAHYTSKDLWNWKFNGIIPLSDDPLLDATVYKKPDGLWGMWYKNARIGYTVEAVSKDLKHWTNKEGIAIDDCPHEAPFVFSFKGYYWLLTDQWSGLGVYRSADANSWEKQGVILRSPGKRKDDGVRASHPCVVVSGERAFVFYFTHPGWIKEGGWGSEADKLDDAGILPHNYRRSSIQVAELKIDQDGVMTCDRDLPFDFYLEKP